MEKLIGYQDQATLKAFPIKPGMTVRIKKGTPVRVTCPGKEGVKPAGKTYTIKVDHVLCGMSMGLGDVDPDGTFYWRVRPKDLHGVMELRGLPYNETTSMEILKQEAMGCLRPLGPNGVVKEAMLHCSNPTVRWPGPGGYWSEADINDVEIV